MKSLIDTITSTNTLSKRSLESFLNLVRLKKFKKKERFVDIGQVPQDFYILESGVVRCFYRNKNGKEHTRHLFVPIETKESLIYIAPITALITHEPSKVIFNCLSDVVIYAINFNDFKKLAYNNLEISTLYFSILENNLLTQETKIYDSLALDATEKYLKLKKQVPQIENLIPQYHIASYLNITPVQLSRIRKGLYSK